MSGGRSQWRGGTTEVETNRRAYDLGRRYIRENPGDALLLWPAKLVALYDRDDHSLVYARGASRPVAKWLLHAVSRPADWYYQALATLGVVGMTASLQRLPVSLRRFANLLCACLSFWIVGAWATSLFVLLAFLLRRNAAEGDDRPWLFLPLVFILGLSAAHFLFFGAARFHAPMMPWLVICAAVILAELGALGGTRPSGSAPDTSAPSQ